MEDNNKDFLTQRFKPQILRPLDFYPSTYKSDSAKHILHYYNPLNFCPSPYIGKLPKTKEEFANHVYIVSYHIRLARHFSYDLIKDTIDEADFNVLYQSILFLFSGYRKWITSRYTHDSIEADLFLLSEPKAFSSMEFSVYALSAPFHKAFDDWWWQMFRSIAASVGGALSVIRMMKEISKRRDFKKNKTVFDYGDYKPFNGDLFLAQRLEGNRTQDEENELLEIFPGVRKYKSYKRTMERFKDPERRFWSFRDERKYETLGKYLIEVLEAIKDKKQEDALKELFDGSLYNYVKNRMESRTSGVWTEETAQKRGGRSPKEIGQFVEIIRRNRGWSRKQFAAISAYTERFITQIETGRFSKLRYNTISKLANALGDLSTADLLWAVNLVHTDFQERAKESEQDTGIPNIQLTYEGQPQDSGRPFWEIIVLNKVESILNRYEEDPIKQEAIKLYLFRTETVQQFAGRMRISDRTVRNIKKELMKDNEIRLILV